jgi:NAD dependent epimerase/dehydratase family enzyme
MPWIHLDDVVGIYLAALDDERWSEAVNATAPEPVTNREFSRALGRALGRPAVVPVPGLALRLLFGEMAQVVLSGQRALPRRTQELGYRFAHPRLDQALRCALGRRAA